jgi:hypothetical protein
MGNEEKEQVYAGERATRVHVSDKGLTGLAKRAVIVAVKSWVQASPNLQLSKFAEDNHSSG